MIEQLTCLMFAGTILLLTLFDKRRLNTVLTPFTATAWPFVLISILVNFALIFFGFPPVTVRVHLFILLNLLILWGIGFTSSYLFKKKPEIDKNNAYPSVFEPFIRFEVFIVVISWIITIATLFKVRELLGKYGGFTFVGDPRFEEMMIVGITAHLIQAGKVCFILLCFLYKSSNRKWLYWLTLSGLFIAIASIQVKYHLLWLFIILFLFVNMEKPVSVQIKSLIKVCVLIIVVMNLFWILLTLAWGTFSFTSKGIWEFLVKQTLNYISSGPIALDKWLSHGDTRPAWTLFLVFINLKNVIVGNPLRLSALNYVTIGFTETGPKLVSNVGTAYGVYYLIGGYAFTILMTIIISSISYLLFYQCRKMLTPYLLFFNMISMTLGSLTFFVQYFTLLSLYEMVFIFIIFIVIFQVLNYLKSISVTPEMINPNKKGCYE